MPINHGSFMASLCHHEAQWYLMSHCLMEATSKVYSPKKAWAFALAYFSLLLLLSCLAGTPQRLFAQPIVTFEQLADLRWWLTLVLSLSVTTIVYGGYWSFHTLRFGRKMRFGWQLMFGSAWGLFIGLWMLSLVSFGRSLVSNVPLAFLLSFGLIAIWQALVQSYFWSVYVAPEHDTPSSNRVKVPRCHVPHLAISLMFYFLFGNGVIFIFLQVLALSITSVAMRMPVWWELSAQLPATTRPGLFGLPRTHGWEEKNG
jgi:hypothetical protein